MNNEVTIITVADLKLITAISKGVAGRGLLAGFSVIASSFARLSNSGGGRLSRQVLMILLIRKTLLINILNDTRGLQT